MFKKIINRANIEISNLFNVIVKELRAIFTTPGVKLILFGAIFIYSFAYWAAYNREVLNQAPIAVVDNSNSPASREFIRSLSASPEVEVTCQPNSVTEAQQLFYNREVYGVFVIPDNFESRIESKKQATFVVYADASYFLMYKNIFSAATKTMQVENIKLERATFMQGGMSDVAAAATAEPVKLDVVKLYNPIEGYATFALPAIILLIIQQTLLIAISMIGASFVEKRLYSVYYREKCGRWFSPLTLFLGRCVAYMLVVLVLSCLVFGILYKLMGLPVESSLLDIIIFLIPFLLSSIALGVALSTLFAKRQNAILTLMAWSIPFLLLSGVSFPKEGISEWLFKVGQIIPTSPAIEGFLKLQLMGVSLENVYNQYIFLWLLFLIYSVLAVVLLLLRIKKEKNILK